MPLNALKYKCNILKGSVLMKRRVITLFLSIIMVFGSFASFSASANTVTQITSNSYTINREEGIILIPYNTTALQVKNAINQDNSLLTISNGTNVLADNDFVVSGMNVTLTGGETLEVITIGDANLDGKLLVTDIVFAMH